MKLIVTLPLPPKALSPNGRCHWAVKARATSNARGDAKIATLSVLRDAGEVCAWDAATVEPHYFHKVNRRRDGDNATACCKAYFDGLADANLVKNDSQLRHLPPVFHIDKADPRVELWITKGTP
jgi:Holliday junction resolvase RusA-like endonuclease